MPPKRRGLRTQAARATREDGDSYVLPPVPPQAFLPIDQDVLRQMVQDAADHLGGSPEGCPEGSYASCSGGC
ncbi:hypothetical protein DY000_02020951 [Brassica cretica]|uniref:Uncharacterized protein n=1 Tax=Brassica cretica TaxID=69181 RepID=A0ABQ7EKA3_BRACR|nr:hypothetical protein DY000_02020951 [Brassica cretica]